MTSRSIRPRTAVAGALIAIGIGAALVLAIVGADHGVVLVPLSLAILAALVLLPFPLADYALALGMLGTLPVLPPSGLPNLPLAAAVIAVAVVRVAAHRRELPPLRAGALVLATWALVAVGAVISDWPPISVWLRPATVLLVGLGAALLGLLVWLDTARLWRWIVGLTVGTLVVSVSALALFGAQFFIPEWELIQGVVASLAYLRGDAAAVAFGDLNNWRLVGEPIYLRAVSPLFPSPNSVGGFLGVGLPLAAALALKSTSSRRVKLLALLTVAAAVATLIVTFSRSSWVAAAAALLAVAAVALISHFRTRGGLGVARATVVRLGMVITIGAVVGLGGVVATLNERSLERIAEPAGDHSVIIRLEGDASALERIAASPLRGDGLGNWTGTAASDPPDRGEHPRYIHNLYLEYAAATGLLGGLWVVLLFFVTFAGGATATLRSSAATMALPGLALVGIGAYGATQALFDDNFLNPQIAWLFAWSFGGGAAFLATARDRQADHERQ